MPIQDRDYFRDAPRWHAGEPRAAATAARAGRALPRRHVAPARSYRRGARARAVHEAPRVTGWIVLGVLLAVLLIVGTATALGLVTFSVAH